MKRPSLSLLAAIALVSPVAWLPVSVAEAQEPPIASAVSSLLVATAGESRPTPNALQSDQRFDQDELADLAALEAGNGELQQQKAGFFGPRIGTLIIIAIILLVVL